jgi:hypothetical protein
MSMGLCHKYEICEFHIRLTEYKLRDQLKELHPPHYELPMVSQSTEYLSQKDKKNRANTN